MRSQKVGPVEIIAVAVITSILGVWVLRQALERVKPQPTPGADDTQAASPKRHADIESQEAPRTNDRHVPPPEAAIYYQMLYFVRIAVKHRARLRRGFLRVCLDQLYSELVAELGDPFMRIIEGQRPTRIQLQPWVRHRGFGEICIRYADILLMARRRRFWLLPLGDCLTTRLPQKSFIEELVAYQTQRGKNPTSLDVRQQFAVTHFMIRLGLSRTSASSRYEKALEALKEALLWQVPVLTGRMHLGMHHFNSEVVRLLSARPGVSELIVEHSALLMACYVNARAKSGWDFANPSDVAFHALWPQWSTSESAN